MASARESEEPLRGARSGTSGRGTARVLSGAIVLALACAAAQLVALVLAGPGAAPPLGIGAGVAVVGLARRGLSAWPAVAAGLVAGTLLAGTPVDEVAMVVAAGLLEAVAGAAVLARLLEQARGLSTAGAIRAALGATVAAASAGAATAAILPGLVRAGPLASATTWSAASAAGVLLVVTWATGGRGPGGHVERLAAGIALLAVVAAALLVRGSGVPLSASLIPLAWIALRLGPRAVAVAVGLPTAAAWALTARGGGPFVGPEVSESFQRLATLSLVTAVLLLLLWIVRVRADVVGSTPRFLPPAQIRERSLRAARAGLAAVIAAQLALFGWSYLHLASFNHDMARDLSRTVDLVTGQGYPVVGPALKSTSLSLGSLTYLLLAPPVLISDDPLFVHLWVVALGTIGLICFSVALRRITSAPVAALGAGMLLATGPWFTGQLVAWHPTLAPTAALVFHAAAALLLTGSRSGAAAVVMCVAAAAAPQLHASMAPLPPLALLVLFVARRRLTRRALGLAVVAGALTLTPLVLALLLDSGGSIQTAIERRPTLRPWSFATRLSELAWYITPTWDVVRPDAMFWTSPGVTTLALASSSLLAVGVIEAVRRERGLGYGRLLVLNLALAVPFSLLLPRAVSARYGYVLSLPALLLIHLALHRLLARLPAPSARALPLMALAALLVLGVRQVTEPHHGRGDICSLLSQRDTARLVVDEVGIPHVDTHRIHGAICRRPGSGYRYFLAQRPRDLDRIARVREENVHAALLPLHVTFPGRDVLSERRVEVGARHLKQVVYRTSFDPRAVELLSQVGDRLRRHLRVTVPSAQTTLHIDARIAGEYRVGGRPPSCEVAVVDATGRPLPLRRVPGLTGPTTLATRADLTGAVQPLEIRVSSCPNLHEVDLY